jgi:hypothetical protein
MQTSLHAFAVHLVAELAKCYSNDDDVIRAEAFHITAALSAQSKQVLRDILNTEEQNFRPTRDVASGRTLAATWVEIVNNGFSKLSIGDMITWNLQAASEADSDRVLPSFQDFRRWIREHPDDIALVASVFRDAVAKRLPACVDVTVAIGQLQAYRVRMVRRLLLITLTSALVTARFDMLGKN